MTSGCRLNIKREFKMTDLQIVNFSSSTSGRFWSVKKCFCQIFNDGISTELWCINQDLKLKVSHFCCIYPHVYLVFLRIMCSLEICGQLWLVLTVVHNWYPTRPCLIIVYMVYSTKYVDKLVMNAFSKGDGYN